MAKFRKRPVIIEAVQYFDWMREKGELPEGVVMSHWEGGTFTKSGDWPTIRTLEGDHIVCPGDWVITGVAGEHYPCRDDIFRQTYEPVAE